MANSMRAEKNPLCFPVKMGLVTVSVKVFQRNRANRISIRERFTLGIWSHNCGNWLSLKSVGQASRVETETGLLCYSLEAKFLLLWEEKVFTRKALSWLDKAHSYNQGQFA